MNRRKGVPCGCGADPCGCSPKNHCVKAINNVSPDPNGDFTIAAGAGIAISQTGDDEITIVNAATPSAYIEGKNIEFTPSGDNISINVVDDPVIDGTLTVNGDIIQNGAAYETHAEKVFTKDDYIVMRDGAISGLAANDYSGFQVEKYDGTNDGRLVIDRDGVARVGNVGDEQPLLTRDETADLTDGHLLEWDANESRAVDSGTDVSTINTAINGKVSGTGNIGSDTNPVKIVNGQAVAVTDELQTKLTPSVQILTPRNDITGITISSRDNTTGCRFITYGNIAILNISITVTGTRSGSTGWYSLFPNLNLGGYYSPYSIGQTPAELSQGHMLRFENGVTYNYTLNAQVIFVHN